MARGNTDWAGFWSGDANSDAAEALARAIGLGGGSDTPAAPAAPAAPPASPAATLYDSLMKQSQEARQKLHNTYGIGVRTNPTQSQMRISEWITSNESNINRLAFQLNDANNKIAELESGKNVDTSAPDASVVGDVTARIPVLPTAKPTISPAWYERRSQLENQYIEALAASQVKLRELLAKKEVRTIRTIDGVAGYPSSTAEFITRLDDENIEDPSKAVTTFRLINPDGTPQSAEQPVVPGTPAAAAAQKEVSAGAAPPAVAAPPAAPNAGATPLPAAVASAGGGGGGADRRVITGQTLGPGGMVPVYSVAPGGGGSVKDPSLQFHKLDENSAVIFNTATGTYTKIDNLGVESPIKQIEKRPDGVYAIRQDGSSKLIRPLEEYEKKELEAAQSSVTSKAESDAVSARYAEPVAQANLENMRLTLDANKLKVEEERRNRVINDMITEGKISPSQGFALLGKFAEFDALENSKQTAFENTRARRMEERAAAAKEIRDYQGGIDLSMNYFGGGNPQYRQQYAQFLNNLPGQPGESQATRMYRSVSGIQGPLPTAYVDPGEFKRAEFAPPTNVDLNAEIARRYPAPVAALPVG